MVDIKNKVGIFIILVNIHNYNTADRKNLNPTRIHRFSKSHFNALSKRIRELPIKSFRSTIKIFLQKFTLYIIEEFYENIKYIGKVISVAHPCVAGALGDEVVAP